ncbi:cobalamin-binding protein [[Clostridium] sordellii]|uniref:cobalamin B12-binding domain-containing protein n=1 Tax=Paraclostridium sordellii TaxID=1505 RepID=UPI0005DB61A0|nr:cobalamin-dependent protein [Paeniclostridium sordellii]CEQ21019.1 cobalamin-binding protein [[Clostridium] sordellii] [Paeniclostridium sordellii]
MDILQRICDCVVNMDKENIKGLVLEALQNKNISIEDIYDKGLNKGMVKSLDMFDNKKYYLSEIIVCSDTLNEGIDVLRSHGQIKKENKGTVVLSVVEGDTHEIGKNIVKIMIESSGYKVIDLGVNKSSKTIIDEAINNNADIIALSSMMTTTMENMKTVINDLNSRKLNKRPKVIIGGGPVSNNYAIQIGADGYSENAPKAVRLIQKLMGEVM